MAMLLRCEAVYYDAATTMSEAVRTMMRMDAEAAQETAAQADAGFLWDFWYPAARSTEIRGQNLRGESFCDARFVPAPGDTAVVRAARWKSGGVLLPRMAV